MKVTDLVEISLAGIDSNRVDVESLEPAVVATEAVTALSQVVAELVENATAFSGPDQTVRVNGAFQGDDYLLTITDDGVGISETMLAALNRILQRPVPPSVDNEVTLGITMVARLAARHGIGVRLAPGVPGTTARVTVPAGLVSPEESSIGRPSVPRKPAKTPGAIDGVFADSPQETIDLTKYEREFRAPPRQHVVSMTDEGRQRAEAFLESVFGPLRAKAATGRDRPINRGGDHGSRSGEPDADKGPPIDREPIARTASLRVRVPGENFSLEDDEPSTASSEGAIDIQSALSRYERGRRDAHESGPTG